MWNQDWFKEEDYDADELGRFPKGAGFPGAQSADWGWAQHILASLNASGRAAIVLDTGAASRGSGNANKNKPADRKGKLFLVNASQVFEKGDPKNFIPPAGIERIAAAFKAWQEAEK